MFYFFHCIFVCFYVNITYKHACHVVRMPDGIETWNSLEKNTMHIFLKIVFNGCKAKGVKHCHAAAAAGGSKNNEEMI